MPQRRAARKMVSPSRPSTSWPSSVKLKGFAAPLVLIGRSLRRPSGRSSAPSPCPERLCEIVGEILKYAQKRIWGRLAETADRGILHGGGQLLEQALVPRSAGHELRGLLGPHPAGRALAAALVLEEAHQVQGHRLHVILLRQDDNRMRPNEAAVRLERTEIERNIRHAGRQDAARGAAREVGLEA